ncbi:MAG: hypothetical protein HOW73_32500 [Polyangiaceae bacterium]|nr:hypothetical protein [Polyangiaceae bacterium]
MKLSHLALRGVAALPDLERDFISASTGRPHDLIVIAGPAASGKTRLCDLMLAVFETIGSYHGIVHASDWYADAARGARAELGLWLDEGGNGVGAAPTSRAVVDFTARGVHSMVDRAAGRVLSRYDHDPAHGKREYFPENRQRAWGARSDGLGAPEQSLLRSSKDPQKYSFVPRFLAELRTHAAHRDAFASKLELLSPTVRYTPAARGGDPTACFTNKTRASVLYEELSSSEADAVLIAATATMIGLNHSIVFLDRPELYVAPDRLVAWMQSLLRLGANNQWIVATSDEGLASAVDRSAVVNLGRNDPMPAAAPRASWMPS